MCAYCCTVETRTKSKSKYGSKVIKTEVRIIAKRGTTETRTQFKNESKILKAMCAYFAQWKPELKPIKEQQYRSKISSWGL